MRTFMHKKITTSEIDPMNSPEKILSFKTFRPIENRTDKDFKLELDHIVSKTSNITKNIPNQSSQQIISFEPLDETVSNDEQLILLKTEVEKAKKSHEFTKQRLHSESESLKKTRELLNQTRKKLNVSLDSKSLRNKKMDVIGEISSKISDDLRDPLTILHSQIDLMKLKHKAQEDQILSNSIMSMEHAISHITNQIGDVLNFIQKPDLKSTICDLKALSRYAINDIVFPKDIDLELSLNPSLIKCDVRKIRSVLTNILENGIQAIGLKGKISLSIKDDVESVRIQITDSGPGIPEEDLGKIFEPMFTTKSEGTGLGLASCKQFVELHGGTINVENNPTTFTITLPKNIHS